LGEGVLLQSPPKGRLVGEAAGVAAFPHPYFRFFLPWLMYFKIVYIIKPLNLGKAEEVSINVTRQDKQVRITLQRMPDEKSYKGFDKNDQLISAVLEQKLSPKREKQFAEIGTTLSNSLKEFTAPILSGLYDILIQTIKQYRWRLRNESGTNLIKFSNFNYYSTDGIDWKLFPISATLVFTVGFPAKQEYSDKEFKSVGDLLSADQLEPLGHDLLHEAWELRRTNPRSSLVIGIAAAETGFKQFCATLAPDASWLIENVPSPPMVKMLEEYLPLIKTKYNIYGHTLPPPKSLTEILKKGVLLRNNIVHGKQNEVGKETVEEILNAIRDLLYLLDFYSGHIWAWEHVNAQYLHELVNVAKKKNMVIQ
jgi:hypothetical protein